MSSKKIIWIVNEYNFPDEKNTRQTNLCRYLGEQGYKAYIISGSTSVKQGKKSMGPNEKIRYIKTDEAEGFYIKTSSFNNNYKRVLVAIQFQERLWKYRKKLPMPDVIVSDFAGLFGNVFLRWGKKYGTKVIYDILDLWPEDFVCMGYLKRDNPVTKILYAMEHKSYREADGIIFSFQGGKDYIIDKKWNLEQGGDIDISNIGYLNNGINIEVVDKQRNEFVLNDSDLDSDKFKAIYLGSISEFNGLDILIDTAKILHDRGNNHIIMLIYGYGTQENRLRNRVKELGLSNIKFKGKLDNRYAINVLSRGDLNLFTFLNTPILKYGVSPNKLFMYFASGKPVLSMIKPAYDLVEEKKAGISVENNPKAIADALEMFSKMNNVEYDEYCHNARKTAEEYDYKKLVNVLIDKIEN